MTCPFLIPLSLTTVEVESFNISKEPKEERWRFDVLDLDTKDKTSISVVKAPWSYGGSAGLWEMAVLINGGIYGEPVGFLPEEAVNRALYDATLRTPPQVILERAEKMSEAPFKMIKTKFEPKYPISNDIMQLSDSIISNDFKQFKENDIVNYESELDLIRGELLKGLKIPAEFFLNEPGIFPSKYLTSKDADAYQDFEQFTKPKPKPESKPKPEPKPEPKPPEPPKTSFGKFDRDIEL